MIKNSFFIFFLFLLAPIFSQTNVSSWRSSSSLSLKLTDKINVEEKDGALSPLGPEAFIDIEEIILERGYTPRWLFASFTKERYTSHIIIQVMDVFTDGEIFQIKMEDPGIVPWQTLPVGDRFYFIVRLVGEDLKLRSVGQISEVIPLPTEENFVLNKNLFFASTDTVHMQLTLEKELVVTLYIYNAMGTVVEKMLNNTAFSAGTYDFYWDPSRKKGKKISGEEYYAWLEVRDVRDPSHNISKEIIRSFTLIH